MVIPKKKDVVIFVPSATIPIPQYRCLNPMNNIDIGIIDNRAKILFLPIKDRKIAPRKNNNGANT